MMKACARAWSARNVAPRSAAVVIRASLVTPQSDRSVDRLEEGAFLAKDEAPCGRHREVLAAFGIGLQPRAIGLVRCEAVEGDERPRYIIGPFMREKVADERAAAARNDAA